MATKARYKRRSFQNKTGMLLATFVVIIIDVVVSVKSVSLIKKVNEYETREEALNSQIKIETARSEEIAEFERYTHTRKYIEDTAKDKLGLVYPGEIIFKNEDR